MDNKIDILIQQLNNLNCKFEELECQVKDLQQQVEPKQEKFFQSFLEKEVGGGHKVNKYGITDVSTETMHIEIKPWRLYKHCLGQLTAYNHMDNKQLVAALYGNVHKKKDLIIKLFHDHNIQVWELHDIKGNVQIIKHIKTTDNFIAWLEDNVIEKENAVLQLNTICITFLRRKVGPVTTAKYKQQVVNFISNKYKNINSEYQKSSVNGCWYRGWLHLALKNRV